MLGNSPSSFFGISEDFVKTSEIPEGFRKCKRNYRDGIEPELTAAVPAEQFRGIPWNSFRGREFRPTLVQTQHAAYVL